MLEMLNLCLGYGDRDVIGGLNLNFQPGTVTGLIGPNGAGKSTFLRGVFGAHGGAQDGQIVLDGTPFARQTVRNWQSRIGFMPQDRGTQGGLTALEVVLIGAVDRLALRLDEQVLHQAASNLDRLGLLGISQHRIETLSGGQRQLVLFAQLLMRSPRVLLLDEPTSALDIRHQMLLLNHVRETTIAANAITIVALHDLNLATKFADRIVLLNAGSVETEGVPGEVLSTALLRKVYGVNATMHADTEGAAWIRVHDATMPHAGMGER
jgi:iron complex transport system ATP-binding protein